MASKNGPNNFDSSPGTLGPVVDNPSSQNWQTVNLKTMESGGDAARLLRECARISAELEPRITSEWTLKRILFFSYELQVRVPEAASEKEKLDLLNHFFFVEKRFERLREANDLADPSDAYRLGRVVASRRGHASILAVIYAFLADCIGIHLDFVDLKPASFLKWNKFSSTMKDESGRPMPRSCYIDITRSGRILSDVDLIATLHSRFQIHSVCHASVLEAYVFETYLCDYLHDLKRVMHAGLCEPELLLFIFSTLISYQPNNLNLVGERALLHRRLGNFKSALADLKRYFAFHERDQAPTELVELYEELVELLERNNPGSPLL
jgi:regulator of sirC expression with transglutaminase-like and TPR domain